MRRAAVFTAPGAPLALEHHPTPTPRGAEILVRVTCCTLCRSDLSTHAGRRSEPTPCVLGHEIVGRIEAFGPDAAHHDSAGMSASVGGRITWAIAASCGACFFCADGIPQKCERLHKYGHHRLDPARPLGGGLADFVVLVPGTHWLHVPAGIPDAVAAQANCATATVAGLLRHAGGLAGRSVLILGAGVLGVTACAMARAAGAASVIACDPSPESRARAVRFGATDAVPPDALAPAGRGFDVVIELAGAASSVSSAFALARIGGTVLLAGTVAPVGTVPFDPEAAVRRMLTIRGIHNYAPRDLAAALAFLDGPGRALPFAELVSGEYTLEQAEEAFAAAHARPGVRVAVRP